jgi:peptidoglycan DL-endopeptidase CwlO
VRPAFRMAMAAATTLALTLPLAEVASADPKPDPVPTQEQVDRARADVASEQHSVDQLESALAAANARLQQAALDASVAAEAYNGAMWRLSEAKRSVRKAEAQEQQARKDVKDQRSGILTFVTESYQNGTELNSATAVMGGEGPKGLMNRYGVVESAGDSMEAAYDDFRKATVAAEAYTKKAAKAQKRQESLAAEAGELRNAAGAAANSAAVAAGQIATQKEQLVEALAEAQNISVELAGKRQEAMEQIAQEKAAAAAQAKSREEAKAAQLRRTARESARDARSARRDHTQAQNDNKSTGSSTGGGYVDPGPRVNSPPPAPVNSSPPAPGTGAQRAVDYAKAQLGKPYLWAAAGPDSFDCSGLTMMAWRQGGKYLPHWSVAQFQQSTRISVGSLRRGDLVFWGSSPGSIHHVAMYIGNGQIIHAPRTGQPVQINSMYYWVPPNYFARP